MDQDQCKQPRIIALSGPHGTGKSTEVFAMAARHKRQFGGEVGIVQEVARRCPYDVLAMGQQTSRRAQIWIFTRQIQEEFEACRHYDTVISDRTIVDCIAYSSVCGFHDLAAGQLAFARHYVGAYREVLFRGAAEFPYLRDDGLRHCDPALQAEVQERMLELYADLGVVVRRVG